jgi:hypothetical protein
MRRRIPTVEEAIPGRWSVSHPTAVTSTPTTSSCWPNGTATGRSTNWSSRTSPNSPRGHRRWQSGAGVRPTAPAPANTPSPPAGDCSTPRSPMATYSTTPPKPSGNPHELRIRRELAWADEISLSTHWFRHTTITNVERVTRSPVLAATFAGHRLSRFGTTATYIAPYSVAEVAWAFTQVFGGTHPLVTAEQVPRLAG